ncbi:MAG: hypothetical protein HS111_29175 [Kofleriaceae bacterium]|nr:hypothetical protein [Kofleriaceae bacterium]
MSEPDPPGAPPARPTDEADATPSAATPHADADVGSSGSVEVRLTDPGTSGAVEVRFTDPGTSGSVDVRFTDPEGQAVPAPLPPGASQPARRKRAVTIPAAVALKVGERGGACRRRDRRQGGAGQRQHHGQGRRVARAAPGRPRTRRGRVMARNVILSFVLVFSWIAVIVGLQLRHARPPDFRPLAEGILVALRDGRADDVYRASSIRFQEVVREDTFVAQMADMNRTLGPFEEISAVLDTELNRGPGGRTGRVDLRLDYGAGPTKGSMAFRWEGGAWKMLGIFIDVPPDVARADPGAARGPGQGAPGGAARRRPADPRAVGARRGRGDLARRRPRLPAVDRAPQLPADRGRPPQGAGPVPPHPST